MTSPSGSGPLAIRLHPAGEGLAGMMMPGFGVTEDVITVNTRIVCERHIPTVVAWAEAQRQRQPERIAFLMAAEFDALGTA